MITSQPLRPETLSRTVSGTGEENIYVDIPPERVNGFLRVKKKWFHVDSLSFVFRSSFSNDS